MKTILVATDFSNNAYNALNYAGALASCAKAEIMLYHFIEDPLSVGDYPPAESVRELVESVKERLRYLAQETASRFDIKVDSCAKVKMVTLGLDEAVEQTSADLVVVGMHTNHWNDRVFGNTATSILRNAKYPVFVVPENASFTGIEKILLAYNANDHQNKNNLALVKDFVDNFKAVVQVLHVETKKRPVAQVSAASTGLNMEMASVTNDYKLLEVEDVISGIEKGIEQYNAHLLVMVPHRLNLWEGIMNQSVTRSMALRTQIPLLALPGAQAKN